MKSLLLNHSLRLIPRSSLALLVLFLGACSSGDDLADVDLDEAGAGGTTSSGGADPGAGGSATGGAGLASGGTSSGGAGAGGSTSGGAPGVGGEAATGGDDGSGGDGTGGDGTGGEGTGGDEGSGGDGSGGDGSGGESSGDFMPSTGPARSMGYLGCSMSVNVAEGYEVLGGERLWPPIAQYNGQVVQNWANNGDAVWGAFDNAVNQYGEPDDVWVMLCIFDNMVTVEEATQIVANVRSRVPDANVYITGQPVYDDPNSCFLAGNGGPDKTDRIAQETAGDASLNLTYPGALGPLSSGESSDGCHTNQQGSLKLGQQFIDWFGE